MKRRYKYILSFLLAVLLAVPGFAHAVQIDLVPYAGAYLTQVIGFTEEEASRFIPEVQEDGSVICRDPDHPEWVYSVYIDRETSQVTFYANALYLLNPALEIPVPICIT